MTTASAKRTAGASGGAIAHVCPLCGGANACAPARAGSFGERCWCESVAFDAAILARVPASSRGVSCICAACAGATTVARCVDGDPAGRA